MTEKEGITITPIDLKWLAGSTTRESLLKWWLQVGAPDAPTPHGPIRPAFSNFVLPPELAPMIELGGDVNRPMVRPNVNILNGPAVDILHDLNTLFPMASGEYGFVYSKFVMEHIKNSRLRQFISECHRITKPGGVNIHIVPNLKAQCASMARIEKWTFHEINTIFAGEEDPKSDDPWEGYHHTGMSPELAVELFKNAGFSEVVIWEYPSFSLEMIVEAWK